MSSPNQAGVYAVSAVLIATSAVAVGLRFRARQIKQAPLKSDDYLVFISMLLGWALGIVLIVGAARETLGTHTQLDPKTGAVIPTWHEFDTSMLAGIVQIISILALGTLKASVVLLYRRIFIGDTFRMASLGALILVIAWTVSFFFATIFECGRDMSLLWQSLKTFKENCGIYKYVQLGHAGSDVITDILVLSIPVPIIMKLHMDPGRKISLVFIFLLGAISTAAGTARLAVVAKDIYQTTTGSRDVRAVETNAIVWTFVEVGVGVIAACLPTLKPIIDRRTPESIVNSVRSKLSLASDRSTKSRTTGSKPSSHDPDSYEMPIIDKRNGSSADVDSIHHDPPVPPVPQNGILRSHVIDVHEERINNPRNAV